MSVKEQLENVFWHHQQVKAKLIQLSLLQELKQCLDRIPFEPRESKKPPVGRPEDVADCIEEMIEILNDEIMDLFDRRWETMDLFKCLKDTKQSVVMTLRYLCAADWEKIAEIMKCSCDDVKEFHDKALHHLEKVCKQQKKRNRISR